MAQQPDKGGRLEEDLRRFFLDSGYYAVRAVPLSWNGFDVTDVDIWLYSKGSMLGRERGVVDAKSRKTPQAMERIVWVRGLQTVLGYENAYVATPDTKVGAKSFARRAGVRLLDGHFLSELRQVPREGRITDEELVHRITENPLAKLDGNWRGRFDSARAQFLTGLGFVSVNVWLEHARFFVEKSVIGGAHTDVATRLAVLMLSYAAIGLDFAGRPLQLEEEQVRQAAFFEGLTFGPEGPDGLSRFAATLEKMSPEGRRVAAQLRNQVQGAAESVGMQGVAELLAKRDIYENLFDVARELERVCYSSESGGRLSTNSQAFLGMMLDHFDVQRPRFFAAVSSLAAA